MSHYSQYRKSFSSLGDLTGQGGYEPQEDTTQRVAIEIKPLGRWYMDRRDAIYDWHAGTYFVVPYYVDNQFTNMKVSSIDRRYLVEAGFTHVRVRWNADHMEDIRL